MLWACGHCLGKGVLESYEEKPDYGRKTDPPPTSEDRSGDDFSWWWFAIGALIAFVTIPKVETISLGQKIFVTLFGGGILGMWWKQLLMVIFGCIALIVAWAVIETKLL